LPQRPELRPAPEHPPRLASSQMAAPQPMLSVSVRRWPDAGRWALQPKWDGSLDSRELYPLIHSVRTHVVCRSLGETPKAFDIRTECACLSTSAPTARCMDGRAYVEARDVSPSERHTTRTTHGSTSRPGRAAVRLLDSHGGAQESAAAVGLTHLRERPDVYGALLVRDVVGPAQSRVTTVPPRNGSSQASRGSRFERPPGPLLTE
jgi:hypothetical protein